MGGDGGGGAVGGEAVDAEHGVVVRIETRGTVTIVTRAAQTVQGVGERDTEIAHSC